MSYDQIICSENQMSAYLRMDISLNSDQMKQIQKELDVYVVSKNYSLNPIQVIHDCWGNIIFFISGKDHKFYCEAVAILGDITHELFENENMSTLPMIENLYMVSSWYDNLPKPNDEGDAKELLRRLCEYPRLLVKSLYEIDPPDTKKVMINSFNMATKRPPTNEEVSYIDAAIVEQVMLQN